MRWPQETPGQACRAGSSQQVWLLPVHLCFFARPIQVEEREQDYEPDFLRHIYPRLNWGALREGAAAMGASAPTPQRHTSCCWRCCRAGLAGPAPAGQPAAGRSPPFSGRAPRGLPCRRPASFVCRH